MKLINGVIKYLDAPNRARSPYSNSLFIDDEIKVLIDSSCGNENIGEL